MNKESVSVSFIVTVGKIAKKKVGVKHLQDVDQVTHTVLNIEVTFDPRVLVQIQTS